MWNEGMNFRNALVVLALAAGAACASPFHKPDAFYSPPEPLPAGKPGDVLRYEPIAGGPDGATSWRILHRSTGMKGEPIVVSGLLVVPDGPAPAAGRDVVAWAHPTI
ncbi:MAG: hypothetical protein RJA59_54, partial [Pseudomonadota bacterium]